MDDNFAFWQKSAKLYTLMQEKKNSSMYKSTAKLCQKYIRGKTVLELACATGQLTAPLAPLAGLWEATDFSPNMIKEAQMRNIPCASFCVQDATNLPYASSSFDVVVIANALHIMPEPEIAIREIRRVLKPHGILIAPTFVYSGKENKLRLFLINTFGFKVYHKWTDKAFTEFIQSYKFKIKEAKLLSSSPLPNLFIAAEMLE